MADRVGQQLGNYKLTRLLGQGGFAEVYLGEHQYLKSQAAIKILQTRLSSQDDMDSFLKEAQTIARLSHPNIIRVMDFGIQDETPYLVMDYAPNGTLRQRHPRGNPVPLTTIIPYVKQIADALQYAHNERLIHRDIKPENMLIGRRDEILLSDFGIALVAQSSRYEGTQDVIGTVAYMSPEQIQGKPRPASDQYSLGIVVYEWLTGERPFHGSFTEMCTQHMFARPPLLSEKLGLISPDVERCVMKALEKDPKDRYPTIQDFATALEQSNESLQTEAIKTSQEESYRTVLMNPTSSFGNSQLLSNSPSGAYNASQSINTPLSATSSTTGNPGTTTGSTPSQKSSLTPPLITPNQVPQSGLRPNFQLPTQRTELANQATVNNPLPTLHSDATVAQTGNDAQKAQQLAGNQNSLIQQNKVVLPPTPTARYNQAPFQPGIQPQQPNQFTPGQPGQQQPYNQAYQQQQQPYQQYNQGSLYPQQQQPYQQYNQGSIYPPQQQSTPPFDNQQNPSQSVSPTRNAQASSLRDQLDEKPVEPPVRREPKVQPRPTFEESNEDWWGILGAWKWYIFGAIAGIIIASIVFTFHPVLFKQSLPIILVVPFFFAAAFGPWVGLIVAISAYLVGSLFYPGHDPLHNTIFSTVKGLDEWWVTPLSYLIIAMAAGLSMLRRRRFPSINSSIRALLLTVIALACYGVYLFYQHNLWKHIVTVGFPTLITVGIGFIALIIYSVIGRLIDTGA